MTPRIAPFFAMLLSLLLTSPSAAQEPVGWTGEVELNGSSTTGNNNTTDVGTKLKLKNRGADWRHDFAFSADYGRAKGRENKRRFRTSYKIGRDLGPRSYIFLNTDYYSDDFGAYKNGYYGGGGLGYSALNEGPTLWRLEMGAGYRSQKARLVQKTLADPITRKEEFASARLFSDFEHAFNDRLRVTNDTELFLSEVDTFIAVETALTSKMFEALALRLSFRVESHTDVPAGREKTDTISRIGIVYKIK